MLKRKYLFDPGNDVNGITFILNAVKSKKKNPNHKTVFFLPACCHRAILGLAD
ncbi:hypothetical protein DDI_4180 [Dickeya dianthicola RNS04.9]|nr:hypothetical protein DDI_4180 [Dickeya dianthicola RNS04.9]